MTIGLAFLFQETFAVSNWLFAVTQKILPCAGYFVAYGLLAAYKDQS